MPVHIAPLALRSIEIIKQHIEELDLEHSNDQLYTLMRDSYQDDSSSTGEISGYSVTPVQVVVSIALAIMLSGSVLFVVWLKLRRANGDAGSRFTLPSLRMPSIRMPSISMPRFGRDNNNNESPQAPVSPSSSAFSFTSRRAHNNHDERTSRLLDNDGLDSSDQYTLRDHDRDRV